MSLSLECINTALLERKFLESIKCTFSFSLNFDWEGATMKAEGFKKMRRSTWERQIPVKLRPQIKVVIISLDNGSGKLPIVSNKGRGRAVY